MNFAWMVGQFHNGKEKYIEFVESAGRYFLCSGDTPTLFTKYDKALSFLEIANNAVEEDIFEFDHTGGNFQLFIINLKCFTADTMPSKMHEEYVFKILKG